MIKARKDRVPRDAYLTPDACSRRICALLKLLIPPPERVLEPSAGAGSFVRAARATWPDAHIDAVEISSAFRSALKKAVGDHGHVYIQPFEKFWGGHERYDLVLGNPPYLLAREHVTRVLAHDLKPDGHLSFLLRMGFLEGADRAVNFWSCVYLRYFMPLAQRPKFTSGGKGNDFASYANFVWGTNSVWSARSGEGEEGVRAQVIMPPLIWR